MSNFQTAYQFGLANLSVGRHQEAIAAFHQVIARKPNHAAAYYNRGVAYYGQKQFDRAMSDLTRAIELAPSARALSQSRVGICQSWAA